MLAATSEHNALSGKRNVHLGVINNAMKPSSLRLQHINYVVLPFSDVKAVDMLYPITCRSKSWTRMLSADSKAKAVVCALQASL